MSKKRVPQNRRSSRVWSIFLIFFILLGLISLVYIIFISDLLKIKTIEINLNKVNCVNTLDIRNSTQLLGKKMFLTDLNLEKKLTSQFPCIKNVDVFRIPPEKVVINISGREAVVTLKLLKSESTQSAQIDLRMPNESSSSGEMFVVDDEGVVFDKVESSNTSIVFFKGSLKINQKLGEEFKNAVSILNNLKVLGVSFENAKMADSILVIYSQPLLIFNLKTNTNKQLASLQLILEKAKMEDATMEFIDLRFENPVVKYKEKK